MFGSRQREAAGLREAERQSNREEEDVKVVDGGRTHKKSEHFRTTNSGQGLEGEIERWRVGQAVQFQKVCIQHNAIVSDHQRVLCSIFHPFLPRFHACRSGSNPLG